MKNLILAIACLSFSFGFSQNDTLNETKVTKRTITTSKGQHTDVKKENTSQSQKLRVENNNRTNQKMRRSATIRKSTTFSTENDNYKIKPDRNGYVMMKMKNGREMMYGKIRKMPNRDFYILVLPDTKKFGYFDRDGNFMIEEYDEASDSVKLKKYQMQKDNSTRSGRSGR